MTKFTETQAFSAIPYVVLLLAFLAGFLPVAFIPNRSRLGLNWLWLLAAFGMALVFNLLCQKTVVTERELTVTFGAFLTLYRKRLSLREITTAEAATYSPIAEYGGWGIRGWGRNIALNARGNRGVRLTLRDGRRVLVGSQQPEELAEALAAPH